jgi:ubiquinone/menaquinone biosynthesis C-methylase UbiE
MGWWEAHVVPRLVDVTCGQRVIMKMRHDVCRGLNGRVLEIGFGSGLNLDALPAEVDQVDAVEPSDLAWSRSAERRSSSRVPVERVGLDGQRIDAEDATYDSALCTFSLCTIPDPALALAEVRRLLKPGGRLHFVEHGSAPDEGVRRWQRRLEPFQRRVAGGCHLTRDPVALVRDAGFTGGELDAFYLAPGPTRPLGYLTLTRVGVGV